MFAWLIKPAHLPRKRLAAFMLFERKLSCCQMDPQLYYVPLGSVKGFCEVLVGLCSLAHQLVWQKYLNPSHLLSQHLPGFAILKKIHILSHAKFWISASNLELDTRTMYPVTRNGFHYAFVGFSIPAGSNSTTTSLGNLLVTSVGIKGSVDTIM